MILSKPQPSLLQLLSGDTVKITKIEPVLAGRRNLYVKVHTDEDHIGWGECGAWGYQEATAVTLKQLEKLLIGQNPMRSEHIWNALTRNMHFRGSIIQAAISGIDIALWDLKGKKLGVPCYELLGGKTRDKVRIYVNTSGRDTEELLSSAKDARAFPIILLVQYPLRLVFTWMHVYLILRVRNIR